MRLSEAIRLGAMINPQGFGSTERRRRKYFFGMVGPVVLETCALGAAFKAVSVGWKTEISDGLGKPFRGQATPAGKEVIVSQTPEEWTRLMWTEAVCPQCGKTDTLHRIIPHLNDDHRWTREHIAGVVERVEAELSAVDAARELQSDCA